MVKKKQEIEKINYKVPFCPPLKPEICVYGFDKKRRVFYHKRGIVAVEMSVGYLVLDEEAAKIHDLEEIRKGLEFDSSLYFLLLLGNLRKKRARPKDFRALERDLTTEMIEKRVHVAQVDTSREINPIMRRHGEDYIEQYSGLLDKFSRAFLSYIGELPALAIRGVKYDDLVIL